MAVADQAGHSVTTLAKHYAGVLEEVEDQPRVPAAEAIRAARAAIRDAGTTGAARVTDANEECAQFLRTPWDRLNHPTCRIPSI